MHRSTTSDTVLNTRRNTIQSSKDRSERTDRFLQSSPPPKKKDSPPFLPFFIIILLAGGGERSGRRVNRGSDTGHGRYADARHVLVTCSSGGGCGRSCPSTSRYSSCFASGRRKKNDLHFFFVKLSCHLNFLFFSFAGMAACCSSSNTIGADRGHHRPRQCSASRRQIPKGLGKTNKTAEIHSSVNVRTIKWVCSSIFLPQSH